MLCDTCGKSIVRVRCDQRWCSFKCASRWRSRAAKGWPPSDANFAEYQKEVLSRTCPVCAKPFNATRKQQRFCTNACTVRGRRRVWDGQPESDQMWATWKAAQARVDGLKTCPQCREDKPANESNFYRIQSTSGKILLCSWCRACQNIKAVHRKRVERQELLRHYGGDPPACACCEESTYEFLCIDHINGGGNKHRAELRSTSGSNFYSWLRRNGFPPGFQVLCHNCNLAKGFYGQCPHERTKT